MPVINVPSGSYAYFGSFLNRARFHSLGNTAPLTVALDQCSFLEPGHIVALACLIEEYYKHGNLQPGFSGGSTNLQYYLKGLRLYDYWKEGFDRGQYNRVYLRSALCLWQINKDMIDAYADHARKFYEGIVPGSRSLDMLYVCLAEQFNNVHDHANSPAGGYCVTQFYPKKKQLVTAVCDLGVGIPTSINRMWQKRGKEALNDCDALRAAIKRRVTTQSTPQNRGFGLNTLSEAVRSLRGTLTILSNFAMLVQDSSGSLRVNTLNHFFPGTLIVVSIDTDALPEAEVEIDEFEFSF
jgi:hypothetical protein